MIILNFFIDLARDASAGLAALVRSGFRETRHAEESLTEQAAGSDDDSAAPILQNPDGKPSYSAVDSKAAPKGLTDHWTDYHHSHSALRAALFHLLLYFVLAILVFSFGPETWPVYDSVYFATAIFTTVGYGDLSPNNDVSRLCTIFLALYGIVILGVFLGIGGDRIIEIRSQALEQRRTTARVKIMKQQFDVIEGDGTNVDSNRTTVTEKILQVVKLEVPILVILALFAIPICWDEHWTVIQSIYWCTITGTTIGFGDLSPNEEITRILCIIYIPLSVAVLGEFLGRIAGIFIDTKADDFEDRFLARSMTLIDLERMDTNNDQKVGEGEFMAHMLVALQKVSKEDIDEIRRLFKALDKSKTGFIDREDLVAAHSDPASG